MTFIVRNTALARRDLLETANYLEEAVGLATAERFLATVEQALDQLAGMPALGAPWMSSHPRLQGIRTWVVPGFRKYLIFYLALEGEIEVIRVLHGARDTQSILEAESGPA